MSYKNDARFYGIDGDKVGATIDAYFIRNNVDALGNFSVKVSSAVEAVRDTVIQGGGTIILCGGDNVLFRGEFEDQWCEELLGTFLALTGCTASMGIGRTTTEAYLALKLAKADGGGRVMRYS